MTSAWWARPRLPGLLTRAEIGSYRPGLRFMRQPPWKVFDPEIEWHDLPTLPGARVHHGTDEPVQRVDDLHETFGDLRTEVEEIRSVGERVVARLRYTGAERVSDAPTTALTVSHLVEFRDGRIFRSRLFADDAEDREAAGLRD